MESRNNAHFDILSPPHYRDKVSENCKLFPVFCTVLVAPPIIDSLLHSSRQPFVEVGGGVGFVIMSSVTETVDQASREPTDSFQSPFLDYSLEEIYKFFKTMSADENKSQAWSQHTFLVLDSSSTCSPPSALAVTDITGVLESVRSDMATALRIVSFIEAEMMSIPYAEARLVGSSGFVTAELWNHWQDADTEPAEVEVDSSGNLWLELVDESSRRLGVVRRDDEADKNLALWKRKDTVAGGLSSVPVPDSANQEDEK